MSRISTSLTAAGGPGAPEPAEAEPIAVPVKKSSKSDAAKADVASETEETP